MIAANGGRFRVEARGQGAPILWLGGSLHDLDHDRIAFRLEPLGRVVAYDQRGLGRTVPPPGDAWTMADYAADAVGVLDALDLRRVDVVGYSFGAMVAQHLAAAAPERIGRLALIAAGPGGPHASAPLHESWALPPERRAARMLAVQDTRVETPAPDAVAAFAARIAAKTALAPDGGIPRLLAARAGHDARAALGRIEAPTVVIGGRHDGQAPPTIVARLADGIPGARLEMRDGGHGFVGETPGPLERIVELWRPHEGGAP